MACGGDQYDRLCRGRVAETAQRVEDDAALHVVWIIEEAHERAHGRVVAQ
jgi:hypothetical protein